MTYIKNHALNAENTGGAVGTPVFAGATTIISTKSADLTNSTTNLNQSASGENLSAKFKAPHVHQDIPAKAKNQYQKEETDEVAGN